jgi:hypothetical protein
MRHSDVVTRESLRVRHHLNNSLVAYLSRQYSWYNDWLRVGVEFRQEQSCYPMHVVQTNYGAHPAFCPVGTGGKTAGTKS